VRRNAERFAHSARQPYSHSIVAGGLVLTS
jgi:hypothetical protein